MLTLLYKLRSVWNTRTCYPGQGWFVRNLSGVHDKSSRGLGNMSRYSAQILICFRAYILHIFFIPLWVWLGSLQDCHHPQCPLPLPIVIRMRLVIRQQAAITQLSFQVAMTPKAFLKQSIYQINSITKSLLNATVITAIVKRFHQASFARLK